MESPVELNSFYQNYFVISPGSLYHLIRRGSRRLANEAFMSNPIVPSKQWLRGLKITNCLCNSPFHTGCLKLKSSSKAASHCDKQGHLPTFTN